MRGENEDYETIRELIGAESAHKLAEAFGGSNVYIPSIKNDGINDIYRAIRQAYKEGKTYRELSVRYGYSMAHIRNIIHQRNKK